MTKTKQSIFCIAFLMLGTIFPTSADTSDKAQSLINNQEYEAALSLLQDELKTKPKAATKSKLSQLAGECCYHMGKYDEAKEYFGVSMTKHTDAYKYLGRIAFYEYRFDDALEYYDTYSAKIAKNKKSVTSDIEKEKATTLAAQGMLDKVEQIVIIDSIATDKAQFFKKYKIATSSGRLRGIDELPFETNNCPENLPIFLNENEEFMMWSQADSIGRLHIMESTRLTDGKWSDPIVTDEQLNDGGDATYPFMMSDGTTLYFANNGENSIGGYDIFRSNRDNETHQYMAPQNVGMPYNSPYDDYLLVIDEESGTGWWATDRNRLNDDKITIYVFIPNEIRTNHDSEDPLIIQYATASNYHSTWEEDADYSELISAIAEIEPDKRKKHIEFEFPIGKGIIYQNYDDFSTYEGRQLMHKYIAESNHLKSENNKLQQLRKQYHAKPDNQLAQQILLKEKEIEAMRITILNLKNEIYKVEK